MTRRNPSPYASRGGEKLAAALDAFQIDPTGLTCADFGCNVGGFSDCLLQRGAVKIYAIDTGYGQLAWKLRRDPRVIVMERTNALHVQLPEPVSLIAIDVAWTRQHLILPAAINLLAPNGRIISLIKPHYEAEQQDLRNGVLLEDRIQATLQAMNARLTNINLGFAQTIPSPLKGQKGNQEYLGLITIPQ